MSGSGTRDLHTARVHSRRNREAVTLFPDTATKILRASDVGQTEMTI